MLSFSKSIITILLLLIYCPSSPSQELLKKYQSGKINFEKVFSIGGENNTEEMLSSVSRIALDKKGNLFILDSHENCVKKFDKNGKFILKFGREGKGPGELLNCYQMAVDPKNRVITNDLGNRRFSIFSNDGKFIKSYPYDNVVFDFKIANDGKMYAEIINYVFKSDSAGTIKKVVLLNNEFKYSKTIISELVKDRKLVSTGERKIPIINPFADTYFWNINPSSEIVAVFTKDYKVRFYDSSGNLKKEITHSGKKLKVTEKDKDEFFKGITFSIGGERVSELPKYIYDNTEFPSYKQYFNSMVLDGDGNILLKTYLKEDDDYYYDVFSSDALFIKNVKLPPEMFKRGNVYSKNSIFVKKGGDDNFAEVIKYTY